MGNDELMAKLRAFTAERDWAQFHTPEKYPVEKAKGRSAKYDRL